VLSLVDETDPSWITRVLPHLDEVLLDHAHCEKKAAAAALKLLFAYPHHAFMQLPLSRLVREELQHFEQMLGVLERRGVRYRSQRPSPYGGRLHAHVGHVEPDRAIDLLVVNALIEARSCERMRVLSVHLPDAELAAIYSGLLACEARHHRIYLDLAMQLGDEATIRARLADWAEIEASILREPSHLVRLHT
jgi:tRNA-(ms[2]io[6]A)-hydroxylase